MKINIQNIDTYLMSYIDNELSLAEIKELELFIKAHPVYEKELTLLKQTVLEADEIEYEDKELLYRYSEMEATLPSEFKKQLYRQETKVVEGFFTRTNIISISSIAALLILFVGYRFYNSGNNLNIELISQNKKANTENSVKAVIANSAQAIEINNSAKLKNEASIATDNNIFASTNTSLAKRASFKIVKKTPSNFDTDSTNLIKFNSKELSTSAGIISETDLTPNSITTELTNKTIAEIEPINSTENTKQAIANPSTPLEEKETYENIDTDDHDRSVYIANLEIDGDKIRGFSRRINAIFKRNKNDKQK
jgi:hypothetical protein